MANLEVEPVKKPKARKPRASTQAIQPKKGEIYQVISSFVDIQRKIVFSRKQEVVLTPEQIKQYGHLVKPVE